MLDSVQVRPVCIFTICKFTRIRIMYLDMILLDHTLVFYTYIIKNLYPNPNEVFDTIIEDEKIEQRQSQLQKNI